MLGGPASAVVFENFDGCLGAAAADSNAVAMAPARSAANERIQRAGPAPVAGRAEPVGLRAPSELELPIGHALAPLGGTGGIAAARPKDGAPVRRPGIIEGGGRRRPLAVPGDSPAQHG